jgi:hypothetical protein
MVVSSGTPFNITLSQDLIGTAQFNQRPALANGAVGPTIVTMPGIGSFNTVPAPSTLRKGSRLVRRFRPFPIFRRAAEIQGCIGPASPAPLQLTELLARKIE